MGRNIPTIDLKLRGGPLGCPGTGPGLPPTRREAIAKTARLDKSIMKKEQYNINIYARDFYTQL
jgi:hypothetical protein